jgi:hypothetical protein
LDEKLRSGRRYRQLLDGKSNARYRPVHNFKAYGRVGEQPAYMPVQQNQILSLTDESAVFYENALSVLTALDDAKASVRNLGKVEGTVRISMPLTLAESHITPLVARFWNLIP